MFDELLDLLSHAATNQTLSAEEEAIRIIATENVHGCVDAIETAQAASTSYPRDHAINIELARLHVLQGSYSDALSVLEKHASLVNDETLHAARRVSLLVHDGQLDRADECAPAFRQENASVGPYPQVRESVFRLSSIIGSRSTDGTAPAHHSSKQSESIGWSAKP